MITDLKELSSNPYLNLIPVKDQDLIKYLTSEIGFSFQMARQCIEWSRDLQMWDKSPIHVIYEQICQDIFQEKLANNFEPSVIQLQKQNKKKLFNLLSSSFTTIKNELRTYEDKQNKVTSKEPLVFKTAPSESNITGTCPVYSEKTLCCNLQTLDVAQNCAFGCTYCSIQSFYEGKNTILLEENINFLKKLNQISINPEQLYHFGSGQSSDSLLWGNKNNNLSSLLDWVGSKPNVILEFKTKSKNIRYFLDNPSPPNILLTWTLSPQTIIDHEELKTSSLDERLRAARMVADLGKKVGFHFHPMMYYQGWEKDYENIAKTILRMFHPSEVALVSMGTLTYTKQVMKEIRLKNIHSKILQMPLVEADGKLSYPDEIKHSLFKSLYQQLTPWHQDVFFYLCMENKRHWLPCFGFEYQNNQEFEKAMKSSYYHKIYSQHPIQ